MNDSKDYDHAARGLQIAARGLRVIERENIRLHGIIAMSSRWATDRLADCPEWPILVGDMSETHRAIAEPALHLAAALATIRDLLSQSLGDKAGIDREGITPGGPAREELRDRIEALEHENARLRNAGGNPFERIAAEARRADRADAVIAETERVIADRGIVERDASAPLPQRVDSIIVAEKNAEYWESMAEMRQAEIQNLKGDLRAQVGLTREGSEVINAHVDALNARNAEVNRLLDLLGRAYRSANREGWEDGPTTAEVAAEMHAVLLNAGRDEGFNGSARNPTPDVTRTITITLTRLLRERGGVATTGQAIALIAQRRVAINGVIQAEHVRPIAIHDGDRLRVDGRQVVLRGEDLDALAEAGRS